MGAWTDIYDATFFLAVGSLLVSALTLTAKYCLKSKCEHFNLCWGLINIDRRVDLETQVDLQQIETGENKSQPSPDNQSQKNDNI
jgi:hypothetical protein